MYPLFVTVVLIGKNIINVLNLWNDDLKENGMGKKFIKEYLSFSVRHIGPTFTRTTWKKLNLKWSMFLDEEDIESYIKSNKLEFVEDPNHQPVIVIKGDPELHIQTVMAKTKSLLHNGYNNDSVIDYLKASFLNYFVLNLLIKTVFFTGQHCRCEQKFSTRTNDDFV